MRHEHVFFSIVPTYGKAKVEEVSAKVVDLFKEFQDIVLDNVPDGLLPVHKISHQRDLILEALHTFSSFSFNDFNLCFTQSLVKV